MKTVLFDLDGTLADINHRRCYLDGSSPDWGQFNRLMGEDKPNDPVVKLYKTLWNSNEYDIIIVTGRDEAYRKISEQWLIWNNIPFNQLIMRSEKDNRADYIVKEEILDDMISKGKEISFTVDDRQQVVDMWRRRGVTCFQCEEGNF